MYVCVCACVGISSWHTFTHTHTPLHTHTHTHTPLFTHTHTHTRTHAHTHTHTHTHTRTHTHTHTHTHTRTHTHTHLLDSQQSCEWISKCPCLLFFQISVNSLYMLMRSWVNLSSEQSEHFWTLLSFRSKQHRNPEIPNRKEKIWGKSSLNGLNFWAADLGAGW